MTRDWKILGIQYGGHDTAAALMRGGEIVAACEQERYNLEKHSRVFPHEAIADCLKLGGICLEEVDEIGFCFDPMFYIQETYLKKALANPERILFLINDIERVRQQYEMEALIRKETGFKGKIRFHKHHLCHLASTYYPSGYQDALVVSCDGVGEIESGAIAAARDGKISVLHSGNHTPHSLGLLYSAITFFLGFRHHCDEGIVMGLAPYGDPHRKVPGTNRSYYSFFEEIVREAGDYTYEVNLEWIAYHRVRDVWVSDKFKAVFGEKRDYRDKIETHHMDIAAALQKRLEDIMLAQLRRARKQYGFSHLALAGGVALNCSLNGKIEASKIFDEIFVQPASGDAGTTIGACYLSQLALGGTIERRRRNNHYLGHDTLEADIVEAFRRTELPYQRSDDIYALTATKLAEGKIVGWVQGRAEFGPRALGNRSILTRPYPAEMKDHLNAQVKFREYFRPFAPACLAEYSSDYFTIGQESPHMLIACQASPAREKEIAAVVHVDHSCRAQTVREENNPRFRKLLEAFHRKTGCPVILNTSFNVKGQPIVNTPLQVIQSFKNMRLDFLAIGDYYSEK